jgi:multisubunit Na+/H+ antiporter MnhC subunit
MDNIINTITTEFHLGLLVIIIMVVIVGIGTYLLKSPSKLKWNYSTTFLVISVLLLGLTLTQLGEAIVKELPGEKESRTKTEQKDKDKNTKKTDVTPESNEPKPKKADTQTN